MVFSPVCDVIGVLCPFFGEKMFLCMDRTCYPTRNVSGYNPNMSIVPRNQYMQQILPYRDQPFIKVITGIRRCGKSAILSLLETELRKSCISDSHIIRINFENLDYSEITSVKELDRYVKDRITDATRYYVLLDEIQEVGGVCAGLFPDGVGGDGKA